ncbi:hypothetical protein B0H17DRAFT_358831 [Mycena rosella]|uniref:Uncharacterized protein n=1 Tax=Mycena rosella TaxID=1033263 RepID=A0AAD7CPN7_MYCRO|nr:hypothetical protein B0H17DRAFT_358831 [Mycena rosella]
MKAWLGRVKELITPKVKVKAPFVPDPVFAAPAPVPVVPAAAPAPVLVAPHPAPTLATEMDVKPPPRLVFRICRDAFPGFDFSASCPGDGDSNPASDPEEQPLALMRVLRRFIPTLIGPPDASSPDAKRFPVSLPPPSPVCVASRSPAFPSRASVVPFQTMVAHPAQVCSRRAAASHCPPSARSRVLRLGPAVLAWSDRQPHVLSPVALFFLLFSSFSRYLSALRPHRHGLFLGHPRTAPPLNLRLPRSFFPLYRSHLVNGSSFRTPAQYLLREHDPL